jgi:brp/blh family beta-carotene 15,15'-monooxygenase
VHTLVLGFVLTLLFYLLTKGYDADRIATLKKPIHIYIGGLTFSIVMMAIIGIYEAVSEEQKLVSNGALAVISGLGTSCFLSALSGPS